MSIFSSSKTNDINLSVAELRDMAQAVLIDVRSPEEYAQGHIPDSVNLPLNRLAAIDYAKDTPLFVYCRSGARSKRACTLLTQIGYSVTDLGGISNYRGQIEKGV